MRKRSKRKSFDPEIYKKIFLLMLMLKRAAKYLLQLAKRNRYIYSFPWDAMCL